jgi:hypothetical protein
MKSRRVLGLIFLALLTVPGVLGAKIGLVVKNADELSLIHERPIKIFLELNGYNVSLIDKNSNPDYYSYDLIIIAGRPLGVSPSEHLDDFVADIPVNDIPSVVMDSVYPESWGWVYPSSFGSTRSNTFQRILIVAKHEITEGYDVGEIVTVHFVQKEKILNVKNSRTFLTPIATLTSTDRYSVIAIGEPGTQLPNGDMLNAKTVFFGVSNPLFWTTESEDLFLKSVRWIISDSDNDGIFDASDNCPFVYNPEQTDTDGDGFGDRCDACPNEDSTGFDSDSDGCIDDTDGDGIKDNVDNCIYKPNPDQADSDNDGIGDDCELLDKQEVYLDVDDDSVEEIAKNLNNISDDGYEFYEDPNGNTVAVPLDGDGDGMTDWLIDIYPYRGYERYWDPDDGILTDVRLVTIKIDSQDKEFYLIDSDGDGEVDISYVEGEGTYLIREKDVDGDGKLEYAVDFDNDRSFDYFYDPDSSSTFFDMIDGDFDGKNDFLIDTVRDSEDKPDKYWDPDDGILTDIVAEDVDGDGEDEYKIDTDEDGDFDIVYDGGQVKKMTDLAIDSISFSPKLPYSGDAVTSSVIVSNSGDFNTTEFTVLLYMDSSLKGNESISLLAGSSKEINFDLGGLSDKTYNFNVVVDLENLINETNEDNNEKNANLTVMARSGGGGGGGHSTATTVPKDYGIVGFTRFQRYVEMEPGETKDVHGKMTNGLGYYMENVTFNLLGDIDSSWFSISPSKTDYLKSGKNINFVITFTVPEDAEIKVHNLTLEVRGISPFTERAFSDGMKLAIVEPVEVIVETTTVPAPAEEQKTLISGLVTFATENWRGISIGLSFVLLVFIGVEIFKIHIHQKILTCLTMF